MTDCRGSHLRGICKLGGAWGDFWTSWYPTITGGKRTKPSLPLWKYLCSELSQDKSAFFLYHLRKFYPAQIQFLSLLMILRRWIILSFLKVGERALKSSTMLSTSFLLRFRDHKIKPHKRYSSTPDSKPFMKRNGILKNWRRHLLKKLSLVILSPYLRRAEKAFLPTN